MSKPRYAIKVVSERTGIPLHTLRAWERRYGVPSPGRAGGSRYRLYGEEDIADLVWLKRQIAAGLSPSQAALELRAQRAPLAGREMLSLPGGTLTGVQAALEAALLRADAAESHRVLDEALALFPTEQVLLQVITPLMQNVGERWLRSEAAVWQEHFASNLLRQRIVAIMQAQPHTFAHAPRLIAACAPEEQHELGLLMVSLVARRQGWGVSYLGQRTPFSELLPAVQSSGATAVCLSVSSISGLTSIIPLFTRQRERPLPIIMGGSLIARVPALQHHLPAAFAGADVLTAIADLPRQNLSDKGWRPPRKLLHAALTLRQQRESLSAEIAARISSGAPGRRDSQPYDPAWATLHLVDTLACALAFDVPELMDDQWSWLRELWLPRRLPPGLLNVHLQAFSDVAVGRLPADVLKTVSALLSRWERLESSNEVIA